MHFWNSVGESERHFWDSVYVDDSLLIISCYI